MFTRAVCGLSAAAISDGSSGPTEPALPLVRGADLIGTPLTSFSKIIAADKNVAVFNGICGAESGGVPVSAASPAIFVSQIEGQKKMKSQERIPVLPAPFEGGK